MDALISLRPSSQMFPDRTRAVGLIFDGADTIQHLRTFAEFSDTVRTEVYQDTLERGLAELWTLILQHRHRYRRLRAAVRALRYSPYAVGRTSARSLDVTARTPRSDHHSLPML